MSEGICDECDKETSLSTTERTLPKWASLHGLLHFCGIDLSLSSPVLDSWREEEQNRILFLRELHTPARETALEAYDCANFSDVT